MPQGVITAIGKSRTGKPTVTIDGQIYSASKVDTSNLVVGDKLEFESSSSVYNGATVWFLNAFKLVQAATKYPLPSQVPVPPPPLGQTPPFPTGGITDAERPFISNCVAHAIAAGAIKEPEQIEKWVSAAKNALRSQDE